MPKCTVCSCDFVWDATGAWGGSSTSKEYCLPCIRKRAMVPPLAHQIIDAISQGRPHAACEVLVGLTRDQQELMHDIVESWEQSRTPGSQQMLLLALRGLLGGI